MIFSFSRIRKMPQRIKKVSCFARASFNRRRLPSLGDGGKMSKHGHKTKSQDESTPKAIGSTCVKFLLILYFKKSPMENNTILYLTALVTSANCMR